VLAIAACNFKRGGTTVTITDPGAPTGVTAVAGDGQATVSWTAPTTTGGGVFTGFNVTATPGGATATSSGATSTLIFPDLTNGTSYTFTVAATNETGASPESAPSNAVTPTATTASTPPPAPSDVVAVAGNAAASLSWTQPAGSASPVTGFTIVATGSDGSSAKFSPTGLVKTFTVSPLTNGTTYGFTVAAVSAAGTSAPSAPSNVVTPFEVPGAPTGVSAVAGNAQAFVAWTTPADSGGSPIASYVLSVFTGGDSPEFSVVAAVSPAIISDLTNGTTYTFTVSATNAAGTGLASSASAPVTPVAPE